MYLYKPKLKLSGIKNEAMKMAAYIQMLSLQNLFTKATSKEHPKSAHRNQRLNRADVR